MTTTEITAKVRKLKKLQAKAEELNAEIKAIQDEIKAEMTAQNAEEIKAGGYKVRYSAVISNRFDTAAFKKLHAKMYEKFVTTTTTRRFTVA